MNTKHTPGPWNDDMGFIMSPDDNYIAEIVSEDEEGKIVSEAQQGANARLIAAAPDLLQAAKEVIAAWERGDLAAAVRSLSATVKEAEG